jgi:hypothetical protein
MNPVKPLEVDPFHVGLLGQFVLEETNGKPRPFRYISVFESRAAGAGWTDWKLEKYAQFENERDEIIRFVRERNLNFARYQPHHFIVITEEMLNFSPILFKLTTGLLFKEQYEFDFNSWLQREGAEDTYPRFYRP